MAQPPSFSSNNPFRRKAPVAPAPASPAADTSSSIPVVPPYIDGEAISTTARTPDVAFPPGVLPTGDQFWSQLRDVPRPAQPPPSTSFQKPKVVKKVRVQSPPPSSPESAGAAARRYPAVAYNGYDDDDSSSTSSVDTDEQLDPFTSARSSAEELGRQENAQPLPSTRPPLNTFPQALRDSELSQGSETGTPKGSLDVDAFRRLLLTGQASSGPSQGMRIAHQIAPTPTSTETSSISRQSISDAPLQTQDTPRTSHEISEQEGEDEQQRLITGSRTAATLQPAPTILRKKPPPPSSRHGKLIQPEAKTDGTGKDSLERTSPRITTPLVSPSRSTKPPTSSDINKPLPPAPSRPLAEEEVSNVFDREAAGKIPEPSIIQPGLNIVQPYSSPRPPTPPNASHSTTAAAPNITPARPAGKPAPPPRRQPHGRSESKAGSTSLAHSDDPDPSTRRSSLDSTRSRSSSLRVSIHAPAPPPPRRPQQRTGGSFSSSIGSPGSEKNISSDPIVPTGDLFHPISSPLSGGGGGSLGLNLTATPPQLSESNTPINSAGLGTLTPVISNAANNSAQYAQNQGLGGVNLNTINHLHSKLSPPPPPPARNSSVRVKRPTSGTLDPGQVPRRTGSSSYKEPPPPVPQHRNRGGSGTGSGASSIRKVSDASIAGVSGGVVAEPSPSPGQSTPAPTLESASSGGEGVDILADLTRLQREVDALRLGLQATQGPGAASQ
ncbi:hypothetical protein QBC35DRAFT_244128 [Podospora australis]|uniref:Uncharacterized protein n=1 Tax=Podospora australis TaxID=1536484 RepID=A0AAN6X1A6_9PEZI|nr:hypothetical protein QBC35DRAFT_244128 [Podospora australis]